MKLPLARYRFIFRMAAPLRLPAYAGSLLRGQFGASLRRVSCLTGETHCNACPLRSTCPYPAIFETPAPSAHAMQKFSHVPNPYVIEPPQLGSNLIAQGEKLQFSIVLFGRAVAQLPLISFALQRAVEGGLARERAHGVLEQIDWQSHDATCDMIPIWQPGDDAIAPHNAQFDLSSVNNSHGVTLKLVTPMRLQSQGHPIRSEQLTPRKLMSDLLRRITLLAEFHANQPALISDVSALVRHAETLSQRTSLTWQDWSRYSARQQREMTLGGVMGDWHLDGEIGPLLPWLRLGQWLHVGKNATMGLGRYTLTE